jgi:hypothetical protein
VELRDRVLRDEAPAAEAEARELDAIGAHPDAQALSPQT